jgi:TolB-like protein
MSNRWFNKGLILALCGLVSPCAVAYEKEIKATAATMGDSIAKSSKKTIAVVDFTDLQGNVTELGRFLAEEFSVALAATGKGFEVVDRTHLKAILAEHKLASTGAIDPATARKLGQVAGVEALVTGTITPFGESVRLAVKGLDTATAKIILAVATDIPKTKAVEELLAKGIQSGAPSPGTASPLSPAMLSGQTTPKTGSPLGAQATPLKAEFKNLSFELLSCEGRTGSVTCRVMVTSVDVAGRLAMITADFWGAYVGPHRERSRIIDEQGNEYRVQRISLGSQAGSSVEAELFPEVPMRVTLVFDNVPAAVSSLALLELGGSFQGQRESFAFTVPFRRVQISR